MTHLSKFQIFLFGALSFTLTGCDNSALDSKVQAFDAALIKSTASIQTYYEQLNDVERGYYFDELRFSPATLMSTKQPGPLPIKDASGQVVTYSTGMLTRFSPDDIDARVSAIQALGKFGQGLAALSGSDAPQRAGKSVEDIGAEVQAIDLHVKALSGAKGSDFTAYAGPISTLGSVVLTDWLQHTQRASVLKSIKDAKEPIQQLTKLLKKELSDLDAANLQDQSSRNLKFRLEYYDRVYTAPSKTSPNIDALVEDDKRKAFLAETQDYAKSVVSLQSMSPKQLITDMDDAYSKLLALAEKPNSPLDFILLSKKDKQAAQQEFDDLTVSIGQFLAEAERVATAIEKIESLSKAKK